MSDLTRRVLDAHAQNPDLEQDTPEKAYALYDLATAAPILARKVEAVEAVIGDAEEWIGPASKNDYDEGMTELIDRILRVLNDTAHYCPEHLRGDPQ